MQGRGPISKDGSNHFQRQIEQGCSIDLPWEMHGSWMQGDPDHQSNESGDCCLGGDHLGELELGHSQ